LKIADVVTAPMVAGHNVIDLKRALLVRHAAEFALLFAALNTSYRTVPLMSVNPRVRCSPYGGSSSLNVIRELLFANLEDLGALFWSQ
jgi:hypothetical protein